MKSATIAVEKPAHEKLRQFCRSRGVQLGHVAELAIDHWVKLNELDLVKQSEALLKRKLEKQEAA